MNFPAILDVGIGLAVVYFLLATICSILVEIIANVRRWRHTSLKDAVNALLRGHQKWTGKKRFTTPAITPEEQQQRLKDEKTPQNQDLLNLFWNHPEIEPLRAPDSESPGYMDPQRFAMVVLDIATGQGQEGVIPNTRAAFDRAFEKYASPKLCDRLRSLLRSLPTDSTDVRAAITAALAQWFNEAMTRTSGAYKRKVQLWLFGLGLVVALFLNCDTLRISYVLFRDPGLRSSMVDYARSLSETAPTNAVALSTNQTQVTELQTTNTAVLTELRSALSLQIKELQKLERMGFPIGWVAPFSENFLPFHADEAARSGSWGFAATFLKIVGLLATAFAVCLGAPFWFDILNKLLKLRSGKSNSDSSGSGGAITAPTGTPTSSSAVGATAGVPLPPKPLPSIGDALRNPVTEFNAAKACWLAEASLLAYAPPEKIAATVKDVWRFDRIVHFDDAGTNTQGFLAVGCGVAILAFRGTEPSQLPDWKTDTEIFLKKNPDYSGEIHSGFAKGLASVYARVKAEVDALPGSGALLYLTGHSLGAALATLCAQRLAAGRSYPIQSVYTFGSPRVGNPEFVTQYKARLGARTYRLVNNEDLVTRVPPRTAGYEHVDEMVYIDDTGKLQRDIGFWYRFLNLAANAAEDFKKATKTTVRDHNMALYCEHLKRATTTPEK